MADSECMAREGVAARGRRPRAVPTSPMPCVPQHARAGSTYELELCVRQDLKISGPRTQSARSEHKAGSVGGAATAGACPRPGPARVAAEARAARVILPCPLFFLPIYQCWMQR